MAFKTNSNGFTFGFAIVMVVVVGAALSFASISLKPRQVQNNITKKMMSILNSVGAEATRANAEEEFYKYVNKRIDLNSKGEIIDTREGKVDASDRSTNPFDSKMRTIVEMVLYAGFGSGISSIISFTKQASFSQRICMTCSSALVNSFIKQM